MHKYNVSAFRKIKCVKKFSTKMLYGSEYYEILLDKNVKFKKLRVVLDVKR